MRTDIVCERVSVRFLLFLIWIYVSSFVLCVFVAQFQLESAVAAGEVAACACAYITDSEREQKKKMESEYASSYRYTRKKQNKKNNDNVLDTLAVCSRLATRTLPSIR